MERKYELLDEAFSFYPENSGNGRTHVYRIKALKDFVCSGQIIKTGDLGGYIESEHNLSQKGDCWVFDGAVVCHNARIRQNAAVCAGAIVADDALVFGDAIVADAYVYGKAKISGRAFVASAIVDGEAKVYGDAYVKGNGPWYDSDYGFDRRWVMRVGNSLEFDTSEREELAIFDNAEVYDHAEVIGCVSVHGQAKVRGNAKVSGGIYAWTWIYENAIVSGHAIVRIGHIHGRALVSYNAKVLRGEKDICGDTVYDYIDE